MIGFFELGSGFEAALVVPISFGAEFHIMASTCVETLLRCMIHILSVSYNF